MILQLPHKTKMCVQYEILPKPNRPVPPRLNLSTIIRSPVPNHSTVRSTDSSPAINPHGGQSDSDDRGSSDSFDLFGPFKSQAVAAAAAEAESDGDATAPVQGWSDSDDMEERDHREGSDSSGDMPTSCRCGLPDC